CGSELCGPQAGRLLLLLGDYEIEIIVYSFTPPGVETITSSPTLWPSSAFPTGDSLDIRPALGFASYAPTSLYCNSRPSLYGRYTTQLTETRSVSTQAIQCDFVCTCSRS